MKTWEYLLYTLLVVSGMVLGYVLHSTTEHPIDYSESKPVPTVQAIAPAPPPSPKDGEFTSELACNGKRYSAEDLSYAVLELVQRRLPRQGDVTNLTRVDALRGRQAITEIRLWAMGISGKDVQSEYEKWIDYFSKQYDKALEELKNPSINVTGGDGDYMRKINAQLKRGRDLAKCLPQPGGPK